MWNRNSTWSPLDNYAVSAMSGSISEDSEDSLYLESHLDPALASGIAALFLAIGYHNLSVESPKGGNAIQRCPVENQKGAIAVQSLWR